MFISSFCHSLPLSTALLFSIKCSHLKLLPAIVFVSSHLSSPHHNIFTLCAALMFFYRCFECIVMEQTAYTSWHLYYSLIFFFKLFSVLLFVIIFTHFLSLFLQKIENGRFAKYRYFAHAKVNESDFLMITKR